MSNKALLVITHGNFGIELVKSVEMIMGEQEDVNALGRQSWRKRGGPEGIC